MKYKYLIAYSYESGVGRVFVTVDKPLNTTERILKVEDSLQSDSGVSNLLILNIIKLKK